MNVINIELSRCIAKQHSYENVARLLYSLLCGKTNAPLIRQTSFSPIIPQCDGPIVPQFHLPTIKVINKIGGPEVDDLHAADVIIAQGRKKAQMASTLNVRLEL